MHTTKLALPFFVMSLAALPVTVQAAGELTLSATRIRAASTDYTEDGECRGLTVSGRVLWREFWELGSPKTTTQLASVSVDAYDGCTPGTWSTVQVMFKTLTPPPMGARLEGPELVVEQDAHLSVCNDLPDGEISCTDSKIPVALRVDWQERGQVVHETKVVRSPQEDGSTLVTTQHLISRAATMFVSGTIGEQIVDVSQETVLKGGEQLEVRLPAR